MNHFSLEDFRDNLELLGVEKGDVLLVHSALFCLGRLDNEPIKFMHAILADELIDYLGPEGSIVVPIFNYEGWEFAKNYRQRQMGAFSKYISSRPNSRRTFHSIFSFSALGACAEEFASHDALSAFSAEGPIGYLQDIGAKVLLIGASVNAASVIHFVEELVGVPYRNWLDLPSRKPIGQGLWEARPYRMLFRVQSDYPTLNLAKVENWLEEDGVVKQIPLGGGKVSVFGVREYVESVFRRLKEEPDALVTP